jgi:hypothetical protein
MPAKSSSASLRPIEDNNRLAALITQIRNADAVDAVKESLDALPGILLQAGVPADSRLLKNAQELLDWLNDHSTASAVAEGTALATRLLHATGAAEYLNLSEDDLSGIQKNLALWNRVSRRGAPAPRRRRAASAGPPARSTRNDLSAAREWARANGYQVKDRGRLPAAVLEGYQASLG